MVKWDPFRVAADESLEVTLARLDFNGPVLLQALEIHAHPSATVRSAAQIYVMTTEAEISKAGDGVLATSGTWSLSDPFRAQSFRFPKPIRVDTGNLFVRAQVYNLGGGQDVFESGEIIVYFEPTT